MKWPFKRIYPSYKSMVKLFYEAYPKYAEYPPEGFRHICCVRFSLGEGVIEKLTKKNLAQSTKFMFTYINNILEMEAAKLGLDSYVISFKDDIHAINERWTCLGVHYYELLITVSLHGPRNEVLT